MTPRAIEKLTNGRTGEIRQRFVIHSADFVLLQTLSGGRITSDSNANYVAKALREVEFLIVQDINFSETARYADVVLPAAPSLDGSATVCHGQPSG